ncbi:MAG: hypothetical protein OXK81_05460 [Chloroflexota bacterium]|nr:hypothetical protein [Chloroflexota bacterium]MDE2931866.1 hypothetical protein [Chloroflexota bacterium]
MSHRAFNLSAFLLISAIVLHLALPFTNGVVCSLPGAQDTPAALTLASFAPDGQLPSFAANDSSRSVAFPEVQPQTGAHGIVTNTVWGPMLVTLSLPTYVLRSPPTIFSERLATNSNALLIWRPPIPFPSSL